MRGDWSTSTMPASASGPLLAQGTRRSSPRRSSGRRRAGLRGASDATTAARSRASSPTVTGASPAACSPWPRASHARQVWPCTSTDLRPIHSRCVDVSPCSRTSGGPSPATCTMRRDLRVGRCPVRHIGGAIAAPMRSPVRRPATSAGRRRHPARTTGANAAPSISAARRRRSREVRTGLQHAEGLRRCGKGSRRRAIIAGRGRPARRTFRRGAADYSLASGRCGCRRSPCHRPGVRPEPGTRPRRAAW